MKIAIVGAGISGLATGQALLARQPDLELVIFESGERTGGKVWTDPTPDGFLCEGGVNGFLDNKPKTLELSSQLGLTPVTGYASAQKRYIYRHTALHKLPETPPAFLTSGLMSPLGRLRVMGEVFVPRTRQKDETLAEFATRRLGREAFEALIDPMASGVFAGDATRLSLKSCFPRIHEVETEYGSLIRGLISLQLKARREGKSDRPGPGPGGNLSSYAEGMSALTDALSAMLGARIRLKTPVVGITRDGSRYTLHTETGGHEETDRLVLAAPAYAQARMLREMAPDIATSLDDIEYPALTVCCLGYRQQRIGHHLDGFGFLIPSGEQRRILGTVVDSNVFPNRAPEGAVLLRSMVGGARAPELARLPDDRIVDLVRSELKDIMGVDATPDFVRLYRHEKAIPQYLVGHAARLDTIDQALTRYPGLMLTGNAFKGVSLNDCVANAANIADSLLAD